MTSRASDHRRQSRRHRSWARLATPIALAATLAWAPSALAAKPNDPYFAAQWASSNLGQPVLPEPPAPPVPGTAGADDRAEKAWNVTTGSPSIVLAEVDTGANYNHPDLAANIWTNPGVGGCPAGTRGYSTVEGSQPCDPMDTEPVPPLGYGGHGTHVAGIIGAVGNNGAGIAGMNWRTTILPVRWRESARTGPGKLPAALRWLAQAKREGVDIKVVNDSAVFENLNPATAGAEAAELQPAIAELAAGNILFVTAAGNGGINDDAAPLAHPPCGYRLPNEICVTATDYNDVLPAWANYGPGTVDLAAPGASIFSTLRSPELGYLSGSSMAAAQVSGAAGLILSVEPALSAVQLKERILGSVDPLPTLQGKVGTGGRLNVCKALPGCEPPPIRFTSRVLKVTHSRTKIGLRCNGSTPCVSRLALTVKVRKKSSRGTRTTKTRLVTIGATRFSVAPGGTARVTIKINPAGHLLLDRAAGHLNAGLTVFASAPSPPRSHTEGVRLVWSRRWQ